MQKKKTKNDKKSSSDDEHHKPRNAKERNRLPSLSSPLLARSYLFPAFRSINIDQLHFEDRIKEDMIRSNINSGGGAPLPTSEEEACVVEDYIEGSIDGNVEIGGAGKGGGGNEDQDPVDPGALIAADPEPEFLESHENGYNQILSNNDNTSNLNPNPTNLYPGFEPSSSSRSINFTVTSVGGIDVNNNGGNLGTGITLASLAASTNRLGFATRLRQLELERDMGRTRSDLDDFGSVVSRIETLTGGRENGGGDSEAQQEANTSNWPASLMSQSKYLTRDVVICLYIISAVAVSILEIDGSELYTHLAFQLHIHHHHHHHHHHYPYHYPYHYYYHHKKNKK